MTQENNRHELANMCPQTPGMEVHTPCSPHGHQSRDMIEGSPGASLIPQVQQEKEEGEVQIQQSPALFLDHIRVRITTTESLVSIFRTNLSLSR